MNYSFDCVFYYVSELDRAIRFYRDVLGLQLKSQDFVARFEIDGVLFEIVPSSLAAKSAQPGNARLCLRVDDVEAALRELRAKGVVTSSALRKENGILGSFFDPDGNEICLWQYTDSHISDRKPFAK